MVYSPLLCVIAEGRKRVFLGNEEFRYDPMNYLVTSLDLPVSGQVIEAPCLGLALALDLPTLAALLLEMPPITANRTTSKAMAVNKLDDELLNPILRLLRLLDRPRDIAVLGPLIEREILYRLLLGPRGEMLRQLALPASHLSQISRAIDVIRRRYDQSLRIEELARIAGMSAPSFHRHFRAVTAMSRGNFRSGSDYKKRGACSYRRTVTPPASASTSVTKAPHNSVANTAASLARRPPETQRGCARH